MRDRLVLTALFVGLSGCAVEPELSTDVHELEIVNGENLNGENLNGENLNGENLNGPRLGTAIEWVSLDRVELGPRRLEAVWIDGAELVASERRGERRGRALIGARFRARSDTGQRVELRIADVEPPPDGDDLWRYRVEYQGRRGGWYSMCHDGTTPVAAFALTGWWDHRRGVRHGGDKRADDDRFTFACPRSGAIGKCVEAGYRPWRVVDGESLDRHHQACVRLMRADYCGDGTSHTVDGTMVNLYDDLGLQLDTQDWVAEGEWDADGARCLSPHNRSGARGACYASLIDDACGAGFAPGTLLVSETPR